MRDDKDDEESHRYVPVMKICLINRDYYSI